MHPTQLEILNSLRLDTSRQFNGLLREVAETSDNLAYHLRQLQKSGFIESPAKGEYRLAHRGLLYLNNNLELGHDLFPTVSCMLELHGKDDKLLVMKKLKQPYLGALHLLTFGVASSQPLNSQIHDFLASYHIHTGELSYKHLYRERAIRGDLPVFDKFFLVYAGSFIEFEPQVDDRQFLTMDASQLQEDPAVLPATKAVLGMMRAGDFTETTRPSND